MARINHTLIMAAGRGMRMMPLTGVIPKAMAPYKGSTLIAKGIAKIKKHIDNIHITVGYKGAMLAQHVIERNVSSVFNTGGKGNSWWLYNTLLKYINEPIFVLTCDNVIELDFQKFTDDYYDQGAPTCMVVPVKPIEGLEGDYIFHNNNIVTELSRERKSDIYCSGIQIINPLEVNQITLETESFHELWNQLIKRQRLYCSNILPEKWFAVDTLSQLDAVNNID